MRHCRHAVGRRIFQNVLHFRPRIYGALRPLGHRLHEIGVIVVEVGDEYALQPLKAALLLQREDVLENSPAAAIDQERRAAVGKEQPRRTELAHQRGGV